LEEEVRTLKNNTKPESTRQVANTPRKRKRTGGRLPTGSLDVKGGHHDPHQLALNTGDLPQLDEIGNSHDIPQGLWLNWRISSSAKSGPVTNHFRLVSELQTVLFNSRVNQKDLVHVLEQFIQSHTELVGLISSSKPTRSYNEPESTRYSFETQPSPHTNGKGATPGIIGLLMRTLVLLVDGFNEVGGKEQLIQQSGLTYRMVLLFKSIMDGIQLQSEIGAGMAKNSRKVNSLHGLCHLYAYLLSVLDLEKQGHLEMLEGALFLLLDRTGKLLKNFVLDEAWITGDEDLADTTTKVHYVEARALVWMLQRAVPIANRAFAQSPEPGPGQIRLHDIVRDKLQYTLLKAVFGDDGVNFEKRFRLPEDLEAFDTTMPPDDNDEEVLRNWFTGEVWRIVGWEALGPVIDWD
jgi:hypothetical protein